jgi:hypothetical protein
MCKESCTLVESSSAADTGTTTALLPRTGGPVGDLYASREQQRWIAPITQIGGGGGGLELAIYGKRGGCTYVTALSLASLYYLLKLFRPPEVYGTVSVVC